MRNSRANRSRRTTKAAVLLASVFLTCSSIAQVPNAEAPRLFIIDAAALISVRDHVRAGDPSLEPAMKKLLSDAEDALKEGPFTVVDKTIMPPSGDKHDYISVGPYWWPNPDTEDGLPYVRRDGETNPERQNFDNVDQSDMAGAVRTLGLTYFLTGDERFAEHAGKLLRVWYLDDATRMNPNLQFGQAIPGRVDGRGVGIIDTMHLPLMLDAVGMLELSQAWTDSDQEGLQRWFSDYLDWMLTHPYGKDERKARNNHGTWYDVQAASYAMFAGRNPLAREILESVPQNRIATQLEPDGSQPLELARTKSFGYSCMNLTGFFYLAALGDHFDLDLWRYTTSDGRGIRKSLDWILDHVFGLAEWKHQNLVPIDPDRLQTLLRIAATAYNEPAYERKLHELADEGWEVDRLNLLWSIPKD